MVYTTKYSKNQLKKNVKKYSEGGPVDDEDADAVDAQMAKNRVDSDAYNYHKDVQIAFQDPKQGPVYTPSQKIDKQMAYRRMNNFDEVKNDIRASAKKTAKRK